MEESITLGYKLVPLYRTVGSEVREDQKQPPQLKGPPKQASVVHGTWHLLL